MATIVERMGGGFDATASQPVVPVVLNDAALERLVSVAALRFAAA